MDTIGPYKILNKISSDFYVCYEGYHMFLDGRKKVVIKLIDIYAVNPQHAFRLFERTVRNAATINHPCIVPIYDVGEQDKYYYIVTRRMLGGTLSEKIDSDSLDENEVLQIIHRIASGLEFAHQAGHIYGWVTSSNILFDENNLAFLSDFSAPLLRTILESYPKTISFPDYDMFFKYSTSELGNGRSVTQYTDLYQLGVNVFEMIAGKTQYPIEIGVIPFRGMIPLKSREFWRTFLVKALAKSSESGFGSAKNVLKYISSHPKFSDIQREWE